MDEEGEQDCRVCLDNILNSAPGVLIRCGHVFHIECITKWIKTSPVCPACKTPVSVKMGILTDVVPVTFPTREEDLEAAICTECVIDVEVCEELAIDAEDVDVDEGETPGDSEVQPVEARDDEEMQRLKDQFEGRRQEMLTRIQSEKADLKEDKATKQAINASQAQTKSLIATQAHAMDDIESEIEEMYSDCQALQDRIDVGARHMKRGNHRFQAPKDGDEDVIRERQAVAQSQTQLTQRFKHYHESLSVAVQQEQTCRNTLKDNYRQLEKRKASLKHCEEELEDNRKHLEVLKRRLQPRGSQELTPSKQNRISLCNSLDHLQPVQSQEVTPSKRLRRAHSMESVQDSQNLSPSNGSSLSQVDKKSLQGNGSSLSQVDKKSSQGNGSSLSQVDKKSLQGDVSQQIAAKAESTTRPALALLRQSSGLASSGGATRKETSADTITAAQVQQQHQKQQQAQEDALFGPAQGGAPVKAKGKTLLGGLNQAKGKTLLGGRRK